MEHTKDIYQITKEESKRINILKVWLAIMVVFIHSYSDGMDFTTGNVKLEFSNFINAYIGYTGNPVLYPLWFMRDLIVLNILAKIIKILIDKFPRIIFACYY